MQRRVSNQDCAADARPHSRREQHPLQAAPSLIGCDCPWETCSLASCFFHQLTSSAAPKRQKALSCKSISDPGRGLYQRRLCWIGLDLLAQMRDINAEVLPVFFRFRTPDFAQDVPVGEDTSRMPDEQAEQGVLS